MSSPNDQMYKSKWKKVVNVLKSSNLSISRIAPAGSRAKHLHKPSSDQDVIFAVAGNPSRVEFYPDLIKILKCNFRHDNVYPGSNNNVVHLDFKAGGKFDLVLLTEREFDREHKDIMDYKRNNL